MAQHLYGSPEALRLYLAQLRAKSEALDRECIRLRAAVSQEITLIEDLIQKLSKENPTVGTERNWKKSLSLLVLACAAAWSAPAAPSFAQAGQFVDLITRDPSTTNAAGRLQICVD